MATKTRTHLFTEIIVTAETEVRFHVELDDDEKCFNRHTFLDALERRLETLLERECGKFEIDPTTAARIAWCHISLHTGDRPDGTVFRGMPILD